MSDSENLKVLKGSCRTKHLDVRKNEQVERDFRSFIPKDYLRLEPWEIEYLYLIGKRSKFGILETGRFQGGSTLVFAHANKDVPIYSIDINPIDDQLLGTVMSQCKVARNDVHLIIGDSQKTKYTVIHRYDVLFVDGDHSYQGCLNDLNNWWDQLEVGGHVVCHDCYFGNEVQDAVLDFISNKNVRIFISPYNPNAHKNMPHGSLCHFQKL